MDITTVILSFNSIKYIDECIRSLVDSLQSFAAYEIFVVDNGSEDGTAERIRQLENEYPGVKGIYFSKNTGTTYSRNTALKRAQGDLVLILDSDAYTNPEALCTASDYINRHPKCGIVAPRLNYPSGKYQKSTDQFPTVFSKLKRFFFLRNIEDTEGASAPVETNVDTVISAFWLLRRETLEKVGLLDEKIFYSPEDIDYCIRTWKAGYYIRYIPQVSIIHDAQELSRSNGLAINGFTLSHAKGLLYLFWKHKYLTTPRLP